MQSLRPEPAARYRNVLEALWRIVRTEGVWRPMRGLNITATGAGPAHALYFACYEKLKKTLSDVIHAGGNSHMANGTRPAVPCTGPAGQGAGRGPPGCGRGPGALKPRPLRSSTRPSHPGFRLAAWPGSCYPRTGAADGSRVRLQGLVVQSGCGCGAVVFTEWPPRESVGTRGAGWCLLPVVLWEPCEPVAICPTSSGAQVPPGPRDVTDCCALLLFAELFLGGNFFTPARLSGD